MMAVAWFVLVISVLLGSAYSADYSGSQVLKICRDDKGLVNSLIKQQHLDVWGTNGTHLDVLVPANMVAPVTRSLRNNNIAFSTMIRDLQSAINKENPSSTKRIGMSFQQYQRLDTIYGYMDELARRNSRFVSVGVLGKTAEGRSMKYLKISSGKRNAKTVFIDGGIHAREWIAPAAVTYVMTQLVEGRNRLSRELQDLDYIVLPVLNADGYEHTHTADRMWRKNRSRGRRCSGADINRNFDFKFGGEGTSGDECSDIYRGRGPGSEPETVAVQNMLRSLKGTLKAYVTFHSYGQYILIPFGYKMRTPAPGFAQMKRVGDEAARAIRQATGMSYTVGNTADTLYPAAGGSDDYAAGVVGVPYVYCIELRDTGNSGFILPARFIEPAGKDAFEAIKVIARAAASA